MSTLSERIKSVSLIFAQVLICFRCLYLILSLLAVEQLSSQMVDGNSCFTLLIDIYIIGYANGVFSSGE